ncbi:MAG TPA: efflux transporter outer membrane subunit, partial [Candidatus Binatia bacterium]|nr:efflux transporter outer membrane subunit [Candidatus Binatia bacterium]
MSERRTRRRSRVQRRAARTVLPAAVAVLFSSCVLVGPDYESPRTPKPSRWVAELERGLVDGDPATSRWWGVFGVPLLDDLVYRAVTTNLDVTEALARVREARARWTIAGAEIFPSVDATGTYERQRSSTAFGDDDGGGSGFDRNSDFFSTGFDASWEIDIFGRRRRALEQTSAELESSQASLRDALVSVVSEVARNYVELRSLQSRIAIAETNVTSQADSLDLVSWRFKAGLVGGLDVDQATYNVANTRARIPSLEIELAAARNRIAVLLGLAPGAVDEDLAAAAPVPVVPVEVAVGVPADLLRRRPDVAAAERQLAAATAAIGVATADLYPTLTLNGTIGFSASDLADIGTGASETYGFGPSIRWNLFDAGRIRAQIRERNAQADQALAAYESAVLNAYEEAENALVAYVREQIRRDYLVEAVTAAESALKLARMQYESGVVDFQQVLEAQRAQLT